MSQSASYYLTASDEKILVSHGEAVFDLVWRVDFTAPGFAVIDTGPGVGSHSLRSWMVGLKEHLSEISVSRGGMPFTYRSMSRFDQQETTKFHLDGAPAESLLILGYEPSKIRSRIFLADYTRAAFDLGIASERFLQDFNPMYLKGEELLTQYVTELPRPTDGDSRILLVNNSSLSFSENRMHPLGVMHQAIIDFPNQAECRIVNSMMLGVGEKNHISKYQVQEFVTTDEISKRDY